MSFGPTEDLIRSKNWFDLSLDPCPTQKFRLGHDQFWRSQATDVRNDRPLSVAALF